MSNFPSYKTKTFSTSQKFFVLDPNTGSPAFVQGSDLVAQITPNSNYVYAESTRTTAQATDYPLGAVIQTGGATSVGDNLAGVYLVVPSGEGDFPMDNGNELLVLAGDDTLREQLALNTTGNGSDLVAHTGTSDTVTEALDKRTIFVGSVAELEGLSLPADGDMAILPQGRIFNFSNSDLSLEVAKDTNKVFYVVPSAGDGANGAWIQQGGIITNNTTITVSSVNKFGSISSALNFLSDFYSSEEFIVELSLASGFYAREQIFITDKNLSFVEITSVDPVVPVARENVTTGNPHPDITASFILCTRSRGPTISTVFEMDLSGSSLSQDGLVAFDGSHFKISDQAGFSRAPRTNIRASVCSTIYADGAQADGQGVTQYGVYAKFGSYISFQGGYAGDTVRHCIRAQRDSGITAENAVSGPSRDGYGVYAALSSHISAQNVTINDTNTDLLELGGSIFSGYNSKVECINATITNPGITIVRCFQASTVSMNSATISGVRGNGFICEDGSTVSGINLVLGAVPDQVLRLRNNSQLNLPNMTATGSSMQSEISGGSSANLSGANLSGATSSTLLVTGTSTVELDGCDLSGSGGTALTVDRGSSVGVYNSDLPNAAVRGILCTNGSRVSAFNADCSGAGTRGITVSNGSHADFRSGNGQKGASPSVQDIECLAGSTVNARSATGGTNIAVNTLTSDGIIFQ